MPRDDLPDRGQPIPGSRWYRNYCQVCQQPIRVCEARRHLINVTCDKCGDDPDAAAERAHRLRDLGVAE